MKAFWLDTNEMISEEVLRNEGVVYEKLNPSDYQKDIDMIKNEQAYQAQDIVELSPETPNLDVIEAKFDKEHLHTDDEVRFVLSGEGIFDIRSKDDRWMRVQVFRGDYISVPKDRYHRFFLTDQKAIRCVRLFKDDTGWTPHYREAGLVS